MAEELPRADTGRLRLAEALPHVPGCADGRQPLSITSLRGGTLNTAYRVQTPAGFFVVRLNEAGESLGIERRREAVLHAAAAGARLAPTLVMADPNGHFLVSEYIEGEPWRSDHMGAPPRLLQLAVRLRALHAVAPPEVPAFDLIGLLRAHVQHIARVEPGDAQRLEGWVRRAERVLSTCGSAERTPCIVHNDLHHSNLVHADSVYLVDWEYAAVADPLFDLACLLAYYPQAVPHVRLLLDESGLAREVSPVMLAESAWLFVLLGYLWYRMRRLTGSPRQEDLAAEQSLFRRL